MRSDRSVKEMRLARLEAENERLRKVAADLQWMSKRYASGRSTYAVSLHNDATRALLDLGIKLNPTGDGTLWAIDGMRSDTAFNELDDAYFEPGHPLATGQVLGLLPHHHLARDLEAVLGRDPLAAIARYAAAMQIIDAVRREWDEVQTCLPLLAAVLAGPMAALRATERATEKISEKANEENRRHDRT